MTMFRIFNVCGWGPGHLANSSLQFIFLTNTNPLGFLQRSPQAVLLHPLKKYGMFGQSRYILN